jgi:hypothetical protein
MRVKMQQYRSFLECERVRLMGVDNQNMGKVVLLLAFICIVQGDSLARGPKLLSISLQVCLDVKGDHFQQ